ncbi:glycosyltransferase [Verticiella sediminum]|uniref:Glycosyltransferase n=1 Tax=Verticiella sediminum TaxID=1247510 RepID=A0A556AWH0_9BURK|nr:glycosyltransferase [Verticiella sediminum]TSH97292.1 glycosyltransferase [Verticiella sediminum]
MLAHNPSSQHVDAFDGRLAIVSHSHPSISKGGAEISAFTLYKGLLDLGIDAVFIAACSEDDRGRLSLGSSREHAVFYDTRIYDHFYQLGSAFTTSALRELFIKLKIDVVNFHHYLNFGIDAISKASIRLGLPTFFTIHEFLSLCHHHGQMITRPTRLLCHKATPEACHTCFPEYSRQQFAIRQGLVSRTFQEVSGFISPSRFLAEIYIKAGLPAKKFAIIENGLAHRPSSPMPPRQRHGDGAWVYGFFGQINPFKGVDTLLKAADVLVKNPSAKDRVRIRIHGNVIGQSEDFMQAFDKAIRTNNVVEYAGPYNNANVSSLMSECDYVVVPSTWWENSPVVIQEAFAVGRPIICTGIGGMAEKIVNGVSGLHFRLNDSADLARVILEGSNNNLYENLLAGVPDTLDQRDMAKRYLAFITTSIKRRVPNGIAISTI